LEEWRENYAKDQRRKGQGIKNYISRGNLFHFLPKHYRIYLSFLFTAKQEKKEAVNRSFMAAVLELYGGISPA